MPGRIAIYALNPDGVWKTRKVSVSPERQAMLRADEGMRDLRRYWSRFAEEAHAAFERAGWRAEFIVLNRWEITRRLVEAAAVDLAFIPHSTMAQFGDGATPVFFYMQVMQRWLFTADPGGWGPATLAYPCRDYASGDPAGGVFEAYRKRLAGANVSKFAQAAAASRTDLIARGDIPDASYIFFLARSRTMSRCRGFPMYPKSKSSPRWRPGRDAAASPSYSRNTRRTAQRWRRSGMRQVRTIWSDGATPASMI